MMRDRLIKFIATGFGVGYLPKAPGTAGSVLGIGLWWLITATRPAFIGWCLFPIAILLAVWSAGEAAKLFGQPDPGCVVIDEIVAMPIALAGIHPVWWQIVVGFAAFRLFDIWKPFPIHQSQQLPGGWGIVVDDLLAGVYAFVLTALIVRVFS